MRLRTALELLSSREPMVMDWASIHVSGLDVVAMGRDMLLQQLESGTRIVH